MLTRRRFMATALAGLVGLPSRLRGADTSRLLAPAEKAIDAGLAYLAANQAKDGALAGAFGEGRASGNVAITSLAALAFMSGGHQPGRGKYETAVLQTLRYVLTQADKRGFLNNAEAALRGPMYNHGFGTLFLAEIHGLVHAPELATRLREQLKHAVDLIINTQNEEGGWRYEPVPAEQADLSVTAAQVMALRAARNAGIAVPKQTIDRAAAYIKRCQVLPEGGFRYMPQVGGPAFPRSAAGLVGLHCCGIYEGREVDGARKYLRGFLPGREPRPVIDQYYLYGHYYAALAMYQAGDELWAEWYTAVRDELCRPDVATRPGESPFVSRRQETRTLADSHYATALACIILQLPKNYLPIFQR